MATSQPESRPGHCMFTGCICCYHACDFEDIVWCYVNKGDCLCLRHDFCMAVNIEPKRCGMTTDTTKGECCKISCFCCDCGLINPTVLCNGASQCLCFQNVSALPFDDDYLSDCVCAYYCIQCAPRCGCCVAPPHCKALRQTIHPEQPAAQAEPAMVRN